MKGIFANEAELEVAIGVKVQVRSANVKLDYVEIQEMAKTPTPREMLVEYLREARRRIDPMNTSRELPLLTILMPCGEKVEYPTEETIPLESVPCACGNPKHWFIHYSTGPIDDDPGANALAAEAVTSFDDEEGTSEKIEEVTTVSDTEVIGNLGTTPARRRGKAVSSRSLKTKSK